MTRPVSERSDTRDISSIAYEQRQLARRPSVAGASEEGSSGIIGARLYHDPDPLTTPSHSGAFINPFIPDLVSSTYHRTEGVETIFELGLTEYNPGAPFGEYEALVFFIYEPGLYAARCAFTGTGFTSPPTSVRKRAQIEMRILQDHSLTNQSALARNRDYMVIDEDPAAMGSWTHFIVDQDTIDDAEVSGNNWVGAAVSHTDANDIDWAGSFHFARIAPLAPFTRLVEP